jgi:TRAP-type mannitol/chloroaromatic compound transport system permease large subunit
MESESSATAFKRSSDLRMLRLTSYLLVAAFGFGLILRLLIVGTQLLTGYSLAFADIAFLIAFSIYLFAALYSLTPRYQASRLRGLNTWYRKSQAERFRTRCFAVLGGLTLAVLVPFALVLVEMARSPGQDIGTSFLAAVPVYVLFSATFVLAAVLWTSLKPPLKAG